MATKFKPRTRAPSMSDPLWRHTSVGGKNECILIKNGSCIPNCVGYAWGRFYEIIGQRPTLSKNNAESWYPYIADGYRRSPIPALGAVACWSKGVVGVGSDGAGHVAIVEEIKANGDIVTSNSGYGSSRFWMQTFKKANGYAMSGYKFQGFILPPVDFGNAPATPVETTTPAQENFKPYRVKITTNALNIRSEPSTEKGSATVVGCIRDCGVYTIVKEAHGEGATLWGYLKSGAGWISLDYTKRL